MADSIRITCITKNDRQNPHERILYVGGTNADGTRWKLPQQDAINGIEAGKWNFWVAVGSTSVWVTVATSRYGKSI
jgi:hypothetical protein